MKLPEACILSVYFRVFAELKGVFVDGVFLSALLPPVRRLILNRKCLEIGCSSRDGFGLLFDDGVLVLNARPDSPGLSWSRAVNMTELPSPVWNHHINRSQVKEIMQPGADRVLHIRFKSGLLYGTSNVTLIFEATGRNANIILVRNEDNRILACHRKITSEISRFRTLVPGQLYVPPPSSGLSPGSWSNSVELKKAVENGGNPSAVLYRNLEGVGPKTARAIVRHSERSGDSILGTVKELERALLEQNFSPWLGPEGPLPIALGAGKPIENPLSTELGIDTTSISEDRLETWTAILRRRLAFLQKRLAGLEIALEGLVSPDKYRTWGNLLLATENSSKKGLSEITLKDWNGFKHIIPLKPSRSLKTNAERFFRKASNTDMEKRNLEGKYGRTLTEMKSIQESLSLAPGQTVDELEALIRNHRMRERDISTRKRMPAVKILSDGWRCMVGRNARDNDAVTFRFGKRGDLWFHARGIPGAHVILKLDGKKDNPPDNIILEAAIEAAKGSGSSSGVIPVDYTRVQYVNRMRKGKPGQVVYTREKTVFIDLDRLS